MSKYTDQEWKRLHFLFAKAEVEREVNAWAYGWKSKPRTPEGKIPDDYYLEDFHLVNEKHLEVQKQIDNFEK